MIPIERSVTALAALLVVAAACDRPSGYLAQQARRHRLQEMGVQPFDTAGRYALEGVSTLHRVEVPTLDPRALGADTLDSAFRIFRERCGACHAPPAPSSETPELWDATITRMRRNVTDAGLIPWSAADETAIRRFLDAHAAHR